MIIIQVWIVNKNPNTTNGSGGAELMGFAQKVDLQSAISGRLLIAQHFKCWGTMAKKVQSVKRTTE